MHLHISDQLVLRDVAGDPADIRSADPLAKQKTQISVAERLGRHFLWTVEAGVIGREENGSRNLVGRESSAVCAMKYGADGVWMLYLPSGEQPAQRLLHRDDPGRSVAETNCARRQIDLVPIQRHELLDRHSHQKPDHDQARVIRRCRDECGYFRIRQLSRRRLGGGKSGKIGGREQRGTRSPQAPPKPETMHIEQRVKAVPAPGLR